MGKRIEKDDQLYEVLAQFNIAGRYGVTPDLNATKIALEPQSYRPFKEAVILYRRRLKAGKPIPDDIVVTIIVNKSVQPDNLSLRPKDKVVTHKIPGGKSCSVLFSPDEQITSIVQRKIPLGEKDRVVQVATGELRAIGLEVVSSPNGRNPLHCLIFPREQRYDIRGDIPLATRCAFAQLLSSRVHAEGAERRFVKT